MENSKNVFMVKNFFNYEKIISPPINLPDNLITVYVTDSIQNSLEAKNLGWDYTFVSDEGKNITDKFKRRIFVAKVNCNPHLFLPKDLTDISKIFVCDSNIISLWEEYSKFVLNSSNEKVLYLTSGYYQGEIDTIINEMNASINSKRWQYNKDQMKNHTAEYVKNMELKNIDISKVSVVSAKYIGWNIKHPEYHNISKIAFKEHHNHLQGNIIFTYFSAIYTEYVDNYYTNNYGGGSLNKHNYEA